MDIDMVRQQCVNSGRQHQASTSSVSFESQHGASTREGHHIEAPPWSGKSRGALNSGRQRGASNRGVSQIWAPRERTPTGDIVRHAPYYALCRVVFEAHMSASSIPAHLLAFASGPRQCAFRNPPGTHRLWLELHTFGPLAFTVHICLFTWPHASADITNDVTPPILGISDSV